MAIEVKEIAFRDTYIEATFEGAANIAPSNHEIIYSAVATACRDHNCLKVLIDRTAVEGQPPTILQQAAGEYIVRTFPHGTRLAVLVPQSFTPHRLEAAVASQGRTVLRLFWDRDKALKWLLKN